ncbi:MAG TPA: 50S ribosomal protein L13 [Terriglobales bacterium]|jgi:large subunit ribosomal protein L13|nr:50S ribosomal protein L13 [Terriglobales bacterium]
MSTYFPKGEIARKWFIVDADGQTLGRLASRVARILSGKNNPRYTPFMDTGDHVIVINAGKVKLTGLKAQSKIYRHYTGFPGGLREEEFVKRIERKPELVIELAVKGMLPKSKLGRAMGSKLKVYRDDKHPHTAQKPEVVEVAAKRA